MSHTFKVLGLVLKKVMGNQDLIEIAGKVFDVDSSDVVTKFGIQLLNFFRFSCRLTGLMVQY
jgi:hypothetical protein